MISLRSVCICVSSVITVNVLFAIPGFSQQNVCCEPCSFLMRFGSSIMEPWESCAFLCGGGGWSGWVWSGWVWPYGWAEGLLCVRWIPQPWGTVLNSELQFSLFCFRLLLLDFSSPYLLTLRHCYYYSSLFVPLGVKLMAFCVASKLCLTELYLHGLHILVTNVVEQNVNISIGFSLSDVLLWIVF